MPNLKRLKTHKMSSEEFKKDEQEKETIQLPES